MNTLKAFIANLIATRKYNKDVKETIDELSRLTNHELNDIGISRGEIYSVARQSHKLPQKKTKNDFRAAANINLRGWV